MSVLLCFVAEANLTYTKLGNKLKGRAMPFKILLVGSKGDWKYEKEFFEMF